MPVRIIFDTQAIEPTGARRQILDDLVAAGIPLRDKTSGGIVHWKMMLFAGQDTVQFSGANYSDVAFNPVEPYVNYVDEIVYFTDQPSLVASFKTRYDDVWTASAGYLNYANVSTPLTRTYPTFPIDSELNFVPWQNFSTRSVGRYNAETEGIDSIIYRITDRRHTDAIIAARSRAVPVRIITEQDQYRDSSRLWHAWNVDRLYMAGVQLRFRGHAGLTHEKLTLLAGQRMVVFGSSNWTSPSASSQLEHNLFTADATFYDWARTHFERKWNNLGASAETQPFIPLPPDRPSLRQPANDAAGQATGLTLSWYAGPWAHNTTSTLARVPRVFRRCLRTPNSVRACPRATTSRCRLTDWRQRPPITGRSSAGRWPTCHGRARFGALRRPAYPNLFLSIGSTSMSARLAPPGARRLLAGAIK